MRKINRITACVKYVFLIAILTLTVIPLIYTVGGSFKSNMEIFMEGGRFFSKSPTFDNYIKAWNSPDFQVGRLFFNSSWYTLLNVTISLSIASMSGYVFAKGRFPFKKTIFLCFTALLFVKDGGLGIYATFDVLNLLHIKRSLMSLVFVHLFNVPIVQIYLVKGYIETLPDGIIEAAKIDGCSFPGIFGRIIAPLLKPILATISILAFQSSWNEYIMPTIFTLTQPRQRPLIVGLMALKNTGESAANWALMLAGSTIAMIPVLAVFAVANRYFVSGLSAGAVKG